MTEMTEWLPAEISSGSGSLLLLRKNSFTFNPTKSVYLSIVYFTLVLLYFIQVAEKCQRCPY